MAVGTDTKQIVDYYGWRTLFNAKGEVYSYFFPGDCGSKTCKNSKSYYREALESGGSSRKRWNRKSKKTKPQKEQTATQATTKNKNEDEHRGVEKSPKAEDKTDGGKDVAKDVAKDKVEPEEEAGDKRSQEWWNAFFKEETKM